MQQAQADYAKWVKLAGIAATVCAITLILTKLIAWFMTDSASILASMTDSFLDLAASLINLMAIRFALVPADDEHRFGHGKAESLAGLAQAAFISGSAILLILHGIGAWLNPSPLLRLDIGAGVSVLAILLTLALVLFQRFVIQKTNSIAIKADSLHYQSDLLMNTAVLIALGLAWYGWQTADSLFAIGIGLYILYGAYQIGRDAIDTLLDRELPEEEVDEIRRLALSIDQVQGLHALRTRQSGRVRFIQMHIELDDHLSLVEAHSIADEVEQAVSEAFEGADVIVHQDPLSILAVENPQ